MKKFRKNLVTSVLVTGLTLPMTAMATNGYFAHGYGTKNKGLAGGGVALPQDAMIAATNPAGMVYVGERMDVGAAIFSPSARSYEATNPGAAAQFGLEPGKYESDNDFFLIPHFAYNWKIDSNSTAGVTVYGNGGMNTEYPASAHSFIPPSPPFPPLQPGVYYDGTAGVNLEQLFINASYSRKLNATNAFGVSLIAAYQRFEAKGLDSFGTFGFSSDPANLSDNGTDSSTGFGLKLGWIGEIAPGLKLAASYQSEIGMSEFDKYKGLFAEQGDFDIPATWTVGLAYNITPKNVLTFDVQQIMYSDVNSIANPLLPNLQTSLLGNSDGAGFGWEDMTIYKLGFQWETSPQWTWRAGVSFGDQPIPNSETLFNIIAPAVMETHLTFGFTRSIGQDQEFNFAAMYAPETSITGANPLGDGQQVTLEMTQYEVEASYSWKF